MTARDETLFQKTIELEVSAIAPFFFTLFLQFNLQLALTLYY